MMSVTTGEVSVPFMTSQGAILGEVHLHFLNIWSTVRGRMEFGCSLERRDEIGLPGVNQSGGKVRQRKF